MHDGQRLAVVVHHILQGFARQTLGAFSGDRFDADAAVLVETDFGHTHFFFQELDHLVRFRRTGFPFDAGINVFGVLAEDGHVDVARLFDRTGHAFKPTHGAQADIQIELLAQGYVQGANTATDRRGQRALDRHDVFLDCIQCFLRQPCVLIVDLSGLLACIDLHPGDFALTAVGFINGCIDDLDHDRADIDTDAVTFDVRNDRVVGHVQGVVCIDGDFFTCGWNLDLVVSHAELHMWV